MIPKSLHTITALVRVARALAPDTHPYTAAQRAADILGYPHGTPDTHQILLKASAQLIKGKK